MDPCPFVRLVVGNLALKIPVAARPSPTVVHPSTSPCFCKIRLKNFPQHMVVVPLIPPENVFPDGRQAQTLAASFHLTASDLDGLVSKSKSIFARKPHLKIAIYTGRRGTTCGVSSGRLIGKVSVPLDLAGTESRSAVFHNGWISVGRGSKGDGATASAQLHLSVWAEPDPRFVFEFEGEPECSPQVSLIQGSIRQPVFTCKFSFGNNGDRTMGSRSMHSDPSNSRSWLSSLGSERERPGKERKGWSITVHELSGSPVALASIVTPFVACPGSDRVSRSNPGAWLILRLGDGTWKPWGRLEAWRERGSSDGLGYRFELLPDMSTTAAGILLAESTLSTSKGGKFVIDMGGNGNGRSTPGSSTSPVCSPQSSGDYGHLWPFAAYRGFVISSTVEGEGKCSRPVVEVGVQHVGCSEDAAVFVALSAAIDMSMDACKLFSHKLRKELCPPQQEFI